MKHKKIISILIICAIIFFFLLLFFTYYNFIADSNFNEVLENKEKTFSSLNSLISPFVAIVAVVLTFLAFYVQFDFNIKQTKYLNNEKVDRKVDEYNKMLDSLISNDNYKDFDYNYRLLYMTSTLLLSFKRTKQLDGNFFTEVIFNGYKEACKSQTNPKEDFTSVTDLYKQYNSQIEKITFTYFKFAYLLEAFNYELTLQENAEKDKVQLIYLFIRKFELLYHNYNENLFFMTVLYNVRKKKNIDLEKLLLIVITNHFNESEDINDIKEFVDASLKKHSEWMENLN